MAVVRCAGCTRKIGVSPSASPLRNKVWCDDVCMAEPAVGTNETRDALIGELSRLGRTDGYLAGLFGIGRSRVQQIAAARR
jgi:hypothetical protein